MGATYLHIELPNIHKPSSFHGRLVRPVIHHREAPSELLAARDKQLSPLAHGAIVLDRAIVAPHIGRSFEALHPAPGSKGLESLPEEVMPIGNTPCQVPHVDKVDAVWLEGPVLTAVFDVTVASEPQIS
jgi:hypothetical protein